MLSRERIIWILAICATIIATFLITNNFVSTSPQTHSNEMQPIKQFADIE
jgi:hypothetical protein